MRTSHSRNSHSSEGVAGGTGAAAGIAQKQIHLYYSRLGGEVKESIESLGAPREEGDWSNVYGSETVQRGVGGKSGRYAVIAYMHAE